jgi:protein TonB
MQPEQIMSSDLLDILFADRNKMYGAYPLRKGYNKRLAKSLLITGTLLGFGLLAYYSSGTPQVYAGTNIILDSLAPETVLRPLEPKPPVPPPPPEASPVATRRHTSYVVVRDDDVKHAIPPVDELNTSQIGVTDQAGDPEKGFPPPPAAGSNSVIAAPAPTDGSENEIRDKVDIESAYPGGPKAWKRFLIKTFRYPLEAEQNLIKGTVLIRFVVDVDGSVSNIQALSGPDELKAEAIRVIGKSGKWTPAVHQGKLVNSYKYQQIVFQLDE